MAEIVLTNVTKKWGSFYAVDNLNLSIGDNAFVTLLGPSGCGKTTTLRMIAGLETPTSGRITIDGVPVFDSEQGVNISANQRKVGFLFQNYALWPNMTVYQNIAFGLSNIKEEKATVDEAAKNAARLVEILAKPADVARAVKDCVDKKGKQDEKKALLRLIDAYEISVYTAKTLLGYKLHEARDPEQAALVGVKALQEKLNDIQQKHAQQGESLNERFEIVRDGKVVTSTRKLTKEEIDLVVRRVSRIVKIGMFMERYPSELSGGQQQRVAIARTLAPGPKVLFMDEPLSNLDAKLRLEMRSELQRLHLETGSTFVYVTHDQMEAMTLATKICLIDNGVLQQYDEPLTVYNKPTNLFVADFVGNPAINFMEAAGAQQADGTVGLQLLDGVKATFTPDAPFQMADWIRDTDAAIEAENACLASDKANKDTRFRYHIQKADELEDLGDEAPATDGDFVVGVRPEFLKISDSGALDGEIFSAMPTGMETTVKIRIGKYLLTGVVFGGVLYRIGQPIKLDFSTALLFSRRTGRLVAQGRLSVG